MPHVLVDLLPTLSLDRLRARLILHLVEGPMNTESSSHWLVIMSQTRPKDSAHLAKTTRRRQVGSLAASAHRPACVADVVVLLPCRVVTLEELGELLMERRP